MALPSRELSELTPRDTAATSLCLWFPHESSLPLCVLASAVLNHGILQQFPFREESRKRYSL